MRAVIRSFTVASALAFAKCGAVEASDVPDFSVSAIAIGVWRHGNLGLGIVEARAVLSPHLHLIAAPTIVAIDNASTEYQLRTGATFLMQLGPIRVDDRNIWTLSDAGTTRYRNRLRLTMPVQVSGRTVRFQLLDEAFYEQGGRGWFRNMLGAGVGLDMGRSASLDAYWLVQDDEGNRPVSRLLVMLTAHVL